ncbi:hypothetical protein TSOC_002523 [Tetrabaena socialis]|uniref:Uncharacterized protein n=1 Tax=Tetrabaena socialis TaxID=47790 RepID=A0A2J8ADZ3_9CHLO|nr:hypothetical protein TSOC_002523 [Tetrabaena socialis]|eukprot:PNH10716.1 hypothetical protein TSOC_002523 [Tetrabaena socialis]
MHHHRRTPSAGALTTGFLGETMPLSTAPPRGRGLASNSPMLAHCGLRTPPTCPASPLGLAIGGGCATVTAGARSCTTTPSCSRRVSCNALPVSQHLPALVTSVYESNITASSCFAPYGRTASLHALTAPPLVGSATGVDAHQTQAGTAMSAGAVAAHLHSSAGGVFGHDLTNDIDFGLAACLATPMDPGPGLGRRLALPAGGTAARSAAAKLSSANEVLQDASRFGEWSRRVRRRRKLDIMQAVLAGLVGPSVLGRLLDDTLLPDPGRRGGSRPGGGDKGGGKGSSRGGGGGGAGGSRAAAEAMKQDVAAAAAAVVSVTAVEAEEQQELEDTKLLSSRGKKHKATGDYFATQPLAEVDVAYSKYEQEGMAAAEAAGGGGGGGGGEVPRVLLRRWGLGEVVSAVGGAGLAVLLLDEEAGARLDDAGLPKLFTLLAEKAGGGGGGGR